MAFEKIKNFQENKFIIITILSFCVFGVFFPVLYGDYLFHDDYVNFFSTSSSRCQWAPIDITWYEELGRPIAGWILCGYGKFIQSPENGSFVRGLVLISIVCMSYLLYVYMVRNNINPFKALLLAILTITVPAVAIFAFWITASFMVIGAIFAVVSGLLVYHVLEEEIHGRKKFFLLILSGAFFIVATLIYQPSAMVYWGLLSFSLWHWISDDDSLWIRKTIEMASVGIICMGLYVLGYIPTLYQRLKTVDQSRSIHPLSATLGRIQDFFYSTMHTVHGLWFSNPFSLFPWIFFGIIVVGIAVSNLSLQKKVVLFLSYPILCVLAFSPVLVSNFPNTFFRTMFPVWIVAIAYLSGSLAKISYFLKQRFFIEEVFLVILLIAGMILQFNFVHNRLVRPSVYELAFIKNKVKQTLKHDPNIKTLVLCPLHYQFIAEVNSDEFGIPTSSINSDSLFILKGLTRKNPFKGISLIWQDKCQDGSNGAIVSLDLTNMLDSKLWPAMQPIAFKNTIK